MLLKCEEIKIYGFKEDEWKKKVNLIVLKMSVI